jgi:hypothetical protein
MESIKNPWIIYTITDCTVSSWQSTFTLRIKAMSLYNHVANKDDLLDGIVDVVAGQIAVPSVGADWKAAMRQRAISAHEVLVRHS